MAASKFDLEKAPSVSLLASSSPADAFLSAPAASTEMTLSRRTFGQSETEISDENPLLFTPTFIRRDEIVFVPIDAPDPDQYPLPVSFTSSEMALIHSVEAAYVEVQNLTRDRLYDQLEQWGEEHGRSWSRKLRDWRTAKTPGERKHAAWELDVIVGALFNAIRRGMVRL